MIRYRTSHLAPLGRGLLILIFLGSIAACGTKTSPTASPLPASTDTGVPTATATPLPTPIPFLRVGASGDYQTIQSAVDSARDGDTIRVAQGTYRENIIVHGSKSVILQGGWSADFSTRSDDRSLTIIDGGTRAGVFDILAADGARIALTIENFTLRNGAAELGGGINAILYKPESKIDLRLIANDISNNVSFNKGGGINLRVNDGVMTVAMTGNRVAENTTNNEGGGIWLSASTHGSLSVTLARNVIQGNTISYADKTKQGGDGDGGGIAAYAGQGGTLDLSAQNNLILGNKGSWGGAIFGYAYAEGSSLKISLVNNILAQNKARAGGAIFSCAGKTDPGFSTPGGAVDWILNNNTIAGNWASEGAGGIHLASGSQYGDGGDIALSMHNDIVWGNTNPPSAGFQPQVIAHVEAGKSGSATVQATYSIIASIGKIGAGAYTLDDVIDRDPLFFDPVNQDFSLRDDSPAIDAGDPDPAYNDGALPPGRGTGRADMGAYGGPNNGGWLDGG